MKKFVTRLLAILATLVMTISVAAEGTTLVSETLPEIDANTSYSEKHQEEPDCHPNCDTDIPLNGLEDY